MFTFMVGGFLTIIVAIFGGWYCLIPAILSLIVLIFPVEGFKQPVCFEEIEVIQLKIPQVGNKRYYVSVKGKKATFAYDNSEVYNLAGVAYEESSVKGRIKIYESTNCERPILKRCIVSPSRELLTFAPFSSYIEYVFYIPEGTVYDAESQTNKSNNIV